MPWNSLVEIIWTWSTFLTYSHIQFPFLSKTSRHILCGYIITTWIVTYIDDQSIGVLQFINHIGKRIFKIIDRRNKIPEMQIPYVTFHFTIVNGSAIMCEIRNIGR